MTPQMFLKEVTYDNNLRTSLIAFYQSCFAKIFNYIIKVWKTVFIKFVATPLSNLFRIII